MAKGIDCLRGTLYVDRVLPVVVVPKSVFFEEYFFEILVPGINMFVEGFVLGGFGVSLQAIQVVRCVEIIDPVMILGFRIPPGAIFELSVATI